MDKVFFFSIILIIIHSCTDKKTDELNGHRLTSIDDNTLLVEYKGEGDVVQFKMFQGLSQLLKKNDDGIFEGSLDMARIDDAVFTYDIEIHNEQEDNKMISVEYVSDNGENNFVWTGENRKFDYLSKDPLKAYLSDTLIFSKALNQERTLTIYRPDKVNKTTPIIYLTDGSNVNDYGPYIENLIDRRLIRPIILVGVHSGNEPVGSDNILSSRYFEYVYNDMDEGYFENHEIFFLEEVIQLAEESIPDWQGERYVYGVSNGGAFSLYAGLSRPHLFKEVIAYSLYGFIGEYYVPIKFRDTDYPKINMAAG